jgi:hypothetical protein
VEPGRGADHAVFVFGQEQDPLAEQPGSRPSATRPATSPATNPAAVTESHAGHGQEPASSRPAAAPEAPPRFDHAGWPAAPDPTLAARRRMAIDPADQAFVDLAGLSMEVHFTGYGEDGQELFQRRARLEMSTLPGGEERLTFADGRVYERLGNRVQATQGRLRRPDLVEQAEAWLEATTMFVRLPHPTALGGGPRGSFDLLATTGGRAGGPQVRSFGRGEERLHVFVDPETGAFTQAIHSPGEGQPDRCVLLEQPRPVGECRFATVRTVLGGDGRTPVLVVRFSQLRTRG